MTLDSTQPHLATDTGASTRGPTRLRLPERVLDEIEERVRGKAEVVGGLLIGYLHGAGYWVERVLPVRNVAPAELRRIAFHAEQRAVENVKTTLGRTALSVVGLYYGGGSLHPGDRGDEGSLGSETEVFWLIPTTNGSGRTPPRAWHRLEGEGSEQELEVELVPIKPVPMGYCPD